MADRWKADADGILIFVSGHFSSLFSNQLRIYRPVCFGCGCDVYWSLHPGPQAKLPGYLCVLSRDHLSATCQPERTRHIHPFRCRQTAAVLSSEIRRLGELTLAFELGHQSYLCPLGNVVASMGTSIRPVHSATTVCPREACTNARILFRWRGQDASSLGS